MVDRDMFKFFYGEELVDPATTQGSLPPFQQGEMEGIVKLSISQTNNMFLLYSVHQQIRYRELDTK